MLPKVDFVGEIGLDFSNEGLSTKAEQLAAFRTIVKALAETNKFVTLHSRGEADTVLDVLEEFGVNNAVFHWYSGALSVLDRAIERGFYFRSILQWSARTRAVELSHESLVNVR